MEHVRPCYTLYSSAEMKTQKQTTLDRHRAKMARLKLSEINNSV